jgi:site-specific recombinase XerC
VRTKPKVKLNSIGPHHTRSRKNISSAGSNRLLGVSAEEFRCIWHQLHDEPFRTILMASACLGLRGNEVMALQWGDFSPDGSNLTVRRSILRGHVSCRKNSHYSQLPVCPALAEAFRKWKLQSHSTQDSDWLFLSPRHDGELPSKQVLRRIRWAAQRAGINEAFGWHTLRYTFMTGLIGLGFDTYTVSRLMRHRNVQTTMQLVTRSDRSPQSLMCACTRVARALFSHFETHDMSAQHTGKTPRSDCLRKHQNNLRQRTASVKRDEQGAHMLAAGKGVPNTTLGAKR